MIGSTLSHYTITAELGRGGMGIVYQATDTKLNRTVAIKVLPASALATENDRARFYREARAAASLHHPHIATIFEIDEVDGSPFIAMEFVSGGDLASEVEKGPFDLNRAVRIAQQIAEALKAAHEGNIVHRDIKCQNIILTKNDDAKVLDFGLAKTAQSTMLTQMGSTLGTVAYMSPEQARGEIVDHRTDLWSLGVVLFEMVAGRRPFAGEYDKAVMYGIMNEDPPPLTGLRTGVPMGLEWIVTKLLAKSPEDRYQTASDLLVDLRTVDLTTTGMSRVSRSAIAAQSGETPSQTSPGTRPHAFSHSQSEPPGNTPPVDTPRKSNLPEYAIGAAIGALLMLIVWIMLPGQSTAPSRPVLRLDRQVPGNILPTSVDISDDGTTVAYALDRVYILDLATGSIQALEGTENTAVVDFSDDGDWLLLTKTSSVERIPVSGGQSLLIVESSEGGPRAIWGPEDWIIYEDEQQIFRYSESRNERIQISHVDSTRGEIDVDWPSLLPDGKTVMGTVEKENGEPPAVRFWDFETGETKGTVNFAGYRARWIKTGFLSGVMPEDGLVVVPFDLTSLEMTGPRRSVVPGVSASTIAISENGTMVYSNFLPPALDRIPRSVPAILTFPSFREPLPLDPGYYSSVELSPDESKIVYVRHSDSGSGFIVRSVFVTDLSTGASKRLNNYNFNRSNFPTWTPDGDSVVFIAPEVAGGPPSIWIRASDGSGVKRRLRSSSSRLREIDVSPDGNTLIYVAAINETSGLLRTYDIRTGETTTLSDPGGNSDIRHPRISPNGRFVAYENNEHAIVRRMDGSGVPFDASRGSAYFPNWASDGSEFFMVTLGGAVRKFRSEENVFSIAPGKEVALLGTDVPYFDVFNDGTRAIVANIAEPEASSDSSSTDSFTLHFVVNAFEELKK